MKLTKNDFAHIGTEQLPDDVIDQILKNQEDAKMWRNMKDYVNELRTEPKDKQIVERLKKYIEQDAILVTGMNDNDLKKELREILGEGK